MKRLFFTLLVIGLWHTSNAQVCNSVIVKTVPEEPTAVDEITLTVEFTCPEYLAWGTEDIYLWVWSPKQAEPVGLPDMFPEATDVPTTNGTGDRPWQNSNEYLKMTKIGTNKYQYVFTPTILFKLNPSDLRSMGFLCKPKNGGGYGDPDKKTTDQELKFKSLEFLDELGRTFPATVSANDIVTIFFNQGVADNAAFAAFNGNLFITITAYNDNQPVGQASVLPMRRVLKGNIPEHSVTLIPAKHLDTSNLPAGKKVNKLIYYFHNQLKTLVSEEFEKILVVLK